MPRGIPERRRRVGAVSDSVALIVNVKGKGVVVTYEGDGIEANFEAIGSPYLDDQGLDDAPEGFSIWEGRLCITNTCWEYPSEYDCELDGTFRDLTDREWSLLRETGVPWELKENNEDPNE